MFHDLPEYSSSLGPEVYGPLVVIALLVALAVPIWVSIGLGTIVMLLWSGALPLSLLGNSLFEGIDAFALIAVPLFILTGDVLVRTGLSARLLDIADAITGGLRSGFGSATVLGCGFFSCISGSDAAGAAAVGRMTIGRLIEEGYPPARACALVASGACTGILIPPSIAYIIIGLVLGISASTLFVAAVVPGIMVLVSIMLTNALLNRVHGYESSDRRFNWKKLVRALIDGRYALMVPLIILGGIYTGIFTPTEAAAVAVISSLIIGLLQGTLQLSDLPSILQSSAKVNGIIVPIIAVSLPFAQTLGALNVAEGFVGTIMAFTDSSWLIILMMIAMLIVAGCIMEATPNIVILSPLLLPLAQSIGMHEVHFCIMMITALGVGFITPPLGLNLFVVSGLTGTSVLSIAGRALPYVFAMLVVVLLLAFIPQLSLWAVQ
jgi:tripartite ATP-independent transporter DctM subunit